MIDVDKLEAGPELDALIAEKVMGWRGAGLKAAEVGLLWSPSTRMGDAWEVVEKLRDRFEGILLDGIKAPGAPAWRCSIADESDNAEAPTAPLAICRAALKAMGT